jgi:hypothetical protein
VRTKLVGKPKAKRLLDRPRRKCDDNIRKYFKVRGCEDVDRIKVAQCGAQWRILVCTVMIFRVTQKGENYSISWVSIGFSTTVLRGVGYCR